MFFAKPKVNFFRNQRFKINQIRRGHNRFAKRGEDLCMGSWAWNKYRDTFVDEFGDGTFLGSLALSLLSGVNHEYGSMKKGSGTSIIKDKTYLSYCIKHVLHKHSQCLVNKTAIKENPFLHRRLCEIHSISKDVVLSEGPMTYSYHSHEDNADPLTIIPDYEYTFNGPVIRLPASYNKEVSNVFFNYINFQCILY